jgi:glycosyltransferase involved in cell wall biosynthesis
MNEPIFSIIVPVYNVEQYIAECLESLTHQTFGDYEIILVIDGSTDDSAGICIRYANEYKRITLIEQENRGLSVARNAGIMAAKGAYILFVDGDDFVSRDICKSVHEIIKTYDVDLVIFDCFRVDDKFNQLFIVRSNYIDDADKNRLLDKTEHLRIFVRAFMHVAAWRRCYKSSIFKELGAFFPEGRIYEEIINTTKISAMVNNVFIMKDAPLYYYRRRAGSIVNSFDAKIVKDSFFATLSRLETIFGIDDNIVSFDDKNIYLHKSVEWLNGRIMLYQDNILFYKCVSRSFDNDIGYILFGASLGGIRRLLSIRRFVNVAYFVDSDAQKHGGKIAGIEVISPERLREIYSRKKYQIIISSDYFFEIANQLMGNHTIDPFMEVLPAGKEIKIDKELDRGLNNLRNLVNKWRDNGYVNGHSGNK